MTAPQEGTARRSPCFSPYPPLLAVGPPSDERGERSKVMEGSWFGLVIMVLLIGGLGVWIWYAMRSDKNKE